MFLRRASSSLPAVLAKFAPRGEEWSVVRGDTASSVAKSAIEYPPMQAAASFNLDAVRKKIAEAAAAHAK